MPKNPRLYWSLVPHALDKNGPSLVLSDAELTEVQRLYEPLMDVFAPLIDTCETFAPLFEVLARLHAYVDELAETEAEERRAKHHG
jgi:hypothetical protein